ncbi:hypothetical protein KRP69_01665 [Mammaliicoccus sciuri]|uniref:hypothetical protein n=1 Tax=Mammaliicoccus sciuri TaxID=1296 RepID=UPI001D0D1AA7|nr:hypothetical protein [Mammaliicoccus sciuri]MCC2087912.1 hypothetical protein [Mammaliicoccus sciuri]
MTKEHDDQLPTNIIEFTSLTREDKEKECNCGIHATFVVDTNNYSVTCKTCGNRVEPFAALVSLTDSHSRYREEIDVLLQQQQQLINYKPHKRVLKILEELFSMRLPKMYPKCPSCDEPFHLEEIADIRRWEGNKFTKKRIKERMKNLKNKRDQ